MCFMGDQSLLVSIVESLPEVSKPKLLKHFGDLRCRDHASLFSYVQAVKRAVEFLGDAEEKNEKSRERDYAVKVAKKERATKLVTEAVANAVKVQGLTDKDDKTAEESALQVVEDEMKKALKEDLTKTLKVQMCARMRPLTQA